MLLALLACATPLPSPAVPPGEAPEAPVEVVAPTLLRPQPLPRWYRDDDGDGYGTLPLALAIAQPEGYVAASGDCDDWRADVHPEAEELCDDGIDNDCDGSERESSLWHADDDGDGYGEQASQGSACTASAGWVANGDDCDDADGNEAGEYDGGGVKIYDGEVTWSHSDLYGNVPDDIDGGTFPSGSDGNVSVDPMWFDPAAEGAAGFRLDAASPLVAAGDPTILNPNGTRSDIGPLGGANAAGFDLDLDGYGLWWLPGAYSPTTSPDLDCDDAAATLFPGSGC